MRTACRANTPLGVFTALYEDGLITRVLFPNESAGSQRFRVDDSLPFSLQVEEFFEGKRKSFDLPLFIPGTQFRQDVYHATIAIPYGETATYGEVAFAAGYPRAMRAVGSAMKANQLPLILPCHRVIHKAKNRDAYSGGTGIKQFLLDLEKQYR